MVKECSVLFYSALFCIMDDGWLVFCLFLTVFVSHEFVIVVLLSNHKNWYRDKYDRWLLQRAHMHDPDFAPLAFKAKFSVSKIRNLK